MTLLILTGPPPPETTGRIFCHSMAIADHPCDKAHFRIRIAIAIEDMMVLHLICI